MIENFSSIVKKASDSRNEVIRSTIQSVFNYMGLGLIITAIVAYFASTNDALMTAIYTTGLRYVVMLAPLGFVIYMNVRLRTSTKTQLQNSFWAFCALMGLSLSYIFLAYTGVSLFRAFAASACMFLSMSIYGYSTERDLTSMGSFMVMGVVGIIVASLINLFMHSAALDYALSIIGVFIFMGLTAWDVQKIKRTAAFMSMSGDEGKKLGIMHALSLYLDFINMFLFLLRIQNR